MKQFPNTPLSFVYMCMKQFWYIIVIQLLVCLVFGFDNSIRPYLVKLMLDSATLAGKDNTFIYDLTMTAALYIGMGLFMSLTYRVQDLVWMKLGPGLKFFIGQQLMDRMMDHSHEFYQNNFAGSVSSKIKDVMSSVPDLLSVVFRVLSRMLALSFAIYALSRVSSKATIALSIWSIVFITVSTWAVMYGKKLTYVFGEAKSAAVGAMVDIISNMSSVRFFAAKKDEQEYVEERIKKYSRGDRNIRFFWLRVQLFQGVSFIIYQSVCLYWLIVGLENGTQTAGDLAFIVTINMSIIEFLWALSIDMSAFAEASGNISQGLNLALRPISIIDKPQAPVLNVTHGKIEFNSVHFNYAGTEGLFENKSVIIEPAQKVGLVGYSGSGKTTFVNLILRLFDIHSGSIVIDGKNIADVTQESLRNAIGMIPQDPTLFHRSILENIQYGHRNATFEEVVAAAKKAHAHEFITQLPQGYESLVGERGVKLSGGQRQRIAIARAFLKNAPILILDEATSQLDSITEQLIQESLWELMQQKTTIVVAHRLSTLLHMDRILVFDQGKIIEDGAHQELLMNNGLYKTLWDAQVGGFLPEDL